MHIRYLARQRPALPALATLILLAGCATGVPPRQAELTLPVGYTAPAPATAPNANLDTWWTLYNDPQLNGLVAHALSRGFSVREAMARLDETRALRAAALTSFNPQGNLQSNAETRETKNLRDADGTSANSAGLGVSRTASLSLPVSWELDLFGRRGATEAGAMADIDAARFELEAARAALAAETARSLFQTRGIQTQRDEALETLRIQRSLFNAVGERAKRGLAPTSEVDRIAADLALAEAQSEDLTAALLASRRALLVVIGSGTDALGDDGVTGTLGEAPAIPAALPGDLLTRRPDVRIAAERVRKSASSVRVSELNFFPRLTLNPGVGITAQRGAMDTTTSFWSLAAGLTIPILDRPRLQAQLDADGARAEQAVLAYERTVQTAFSEADQSMTRLQADRRRVATLQAGEARAQNAYNAVNKRYELGFANLQELLDGERAWRATRSALTGAKLDMLQRSVQVFQALGGGWTATPPKTETQG